MTATTRLHVTPLRPDLLPIVLGPKLLEIVQNISYQTIETFPENSYGFVELPETDAKKLTSKLNGAILKGRIMKVEEARTSKRSRKQTDETAVEVQQERPVKRQKKSKKDLNVLEGHEVEDGRKVKRGWTDSSLEKSKSKKDKHKKEKATKHQAASKYSDKDELLFRTDVPPNKQDLDTTKKRVKGKKNDTSPTLIHEFEKTTIQPKFLRDATSSKSRSAEFVDGKGWVDQNGSLIEEEPPTVKRSKQKNRKGLNITLPAAPAETEFDPSTATKEAQNIGSANSVDAGERISSSRLKSDASTTPLDDETSSSGTSSSDDGINDDLISDKSDKKEISEPPATPPSVHPLEALFKKPKPSIVNDAAKPSLEVETSFSFFDRGDDEAEDDLPPMPMTPFTSQDINQRTMRSAAPTPDTAHPSRFTSFAAALGAREKHAPSDEGEDASDGPGNYDLEKSNSAVQRPQSGFEKRFWAERGQNNRAWKARNRTARKEQRQVENRLRRPRHGI